MASTLYLRHQAIHSIFELLGRKENDLTFSLGWALQECPSFRAAFVNHVVQSRPDLAIRRISLQEHDKTLGGYTDIELFGTDLHLVVEAKKGWTLPEQRQLRLYAKRLQHDRVAIRQIVILTERTASGLSGLPKSVDSINVQHVSWREILQLANQPSSSHAEKRLLIQLRGYIAGSITMHNKESNLVYVVALAMGRPTRSQMSWKEIVDRGMYFHPVNEGGWPREPPTYLGFRYDGKLQSIRFVEEAEVFDDLGAARPEFPSEKGQRRWLYRLGPAIVPPKVVRTGNIYRNGRVWAMFDLLLTSESISDAVAATKKRRARSEG